MTDNEIQIAAIKYARRCWPMSMQSNGYTKNQLIQIRHFASEDYFAGMRDALTNKQLDNAAKDSDGRESDKDVL